MSETPRVPNGAKALLRQRDHWKAVREFPWGKENSFKLL